jgi:hypothetical protein
VQDRRSRAYHRLQCLFVQFHGTFAVSDKEGQIEQIFNGLAEIIGVDDEAEHIYRASFVVEKFCDLTPGLIRLGRNMQRIPMEGADLSHILCCLIFRTSDIFFSYFLRFPFVFFMLLQFGTLDLGTFLLLY